MSDPPRLLPLWQVRLAATASAPAAIRVRNLHASVAGPRDAWGRPSRPQPASVSAVVALRDAFGVSTATDSVAADTVHYGLLSKAILASLGRPLMKQENKNEEVVVPSEGDLAHVLGGIWGSLAGRDITTGQDMRHELVDEPFLALRGISGVEIQVHLPKASLLGDGVSVIHIAEFAPAPGQGHETHHAEMRSSCTCLKIHDVRVPTLIGVNDNERTAKQSVTANLEIEHVHPADLDSHHIITAKLVQSMSDSSFETLEALAKRIATEITTLLYASFSAYGDRGTKPSWGLRITLEKPIAVVFADAACVELYVNTEDVMLE